MIVVHVTHEAVDKVGGIGAVIAGLVTSEAYQESVTRTILLGPLLDTGKPVNLRLGVSGKVHYSSLDNIQTRPWHDKFLPIERTYDVGIIYGTRTVHDPCTDKAVEVEVLLVDVFHANKVRLNLFKGELYRKFAVPSSQFEHIWEYEEYVRLAEPGDEALKAIGCNGDEPILLLSHEYMGMPTALKMVLDGAKNTRTVFYAHEVAPVRPIVEKGPGHDTMFYNVMQRMAAEGRSLEQVFPEVLDNYKHALVKAARYCDHVFAVGDYIREELRFLDGHFRTMDLDLVYNGIPAQPLSLAEKRLSRQRMKQYTRNLFGFEPTWIFAHVCRPVPSKALWRDIAVLRELEPLLAARGETAVYYLLATMAGQRRPQDVRQMERVYGWPAAHENGYPDLCQGEEGLGAMMADFNEDHHATRAVFVNQWDWCHEFCGERMPKDMTFGDIRRGTDVEFGLSCYEPFGISQLEPLCFGAICILSNVCGCTGFARAASAGQPTDNIIEANFLHVPAEATAQEMLDLGVQARDRIEQDEARRLAEALIERLPRSDQDLQRLMRSGYDLSQRMSWDHVVKEYFLPALNKAAR